MNNFSASIKSILTMYVLWSLILVIYGTWVVFTSGYDEKISNEAFHGFIVMYYGVFLVLFALGALLAWQAQLGKAWALWSFIAYCVYRAIDSIWSTQARESMGVTAVDIIDWIKAFIIAAVWISLIALSLYNRPNKSLNLTGANNAPPS
jgi:hypothetical protein